MPANTPRLTLPYPLPADSINVPRDIQALAEAVEGRPGPACILYKTDQFINISQWSDVTWATPLYKSLMTTPNATDIRFDHRGIYDVNIAARFGAVASGQRLVAISNRSTGYAYWEAAIPNTGNHGTGFSFGGSTVFNAGDTIYVRVYQDSTAGLVLQGAQAGGLFTTLSVLWRGSA